MLYSDVRFRQTETAPPRHGVKIDLTLLLLTLLLLGIGVLMVLSASFASAYYDLQG